MLMQVMTLLLAWAGPVAAGLQPEAKSPGIVAPDSNEARAAARAFGRLHLVMADGTNRTCYAILIAPGVALTSLQGIDEAVEARMAMICCGEFPVEGVVAADEDLNLALIKVSGGDVESESALPARTRPGPGEKVLVSVPLDQTGFLAVPSSIAEVTDWEAIRPALIIDSGIKELSGWGPVFNEEGGLCGFIVGTAGQKRSLVAPFPAETLKPGPTISLKDWAARPRSPVVRSRAMAHRAELGDAPAAAAIEPLREAVAVNAGNGRAWWRLGVVLDEAGRGDEAVQPLERAAELLPRFSEAPYSLGLVYLKQGKSAEAVPYFERAVSIEPGHADAHAMLAVALHQSGRSADAIPSAREACRLQPERFQHFQNLAIILKSAARPGEIPDVWKSYCEHHPGDAAGWAELGSSLFSADRFEEAERALRKADELGPGRSGTVMRLATCLGKLNRAQEGVAVIDMYLKDNPDDQLAQRIRAALQRAGRP